MSPYEKQLYTQFNLTPSQARAIAKNTKPSTKISAATTQVRQGPMKESEGKRKKPLPLPISKAPTRPSRIKPKKGPR